jgi:hypothetical protein
VSADGGNAGLLTKALKDLIVKWEESGNAWRDQARTDFDKEFLQQIIPAVRGASRAAQEIENLLQRVRSEIS